MDQYYREHNELVFHYLCQLTGHRDLAEELTQETFYQAMRTYSKYRGDCKPSVWLCQIAKHVWYQYLEKKKKKSEISFERVEDFIAENDSTSEFWDRQDKIELYKKIQTLSKEMRDVIYLRLSGDLSFAEIGEIMKKTENWARVTYYRAKQQLMKGGSL